MLWIDVPTWDGKWRCARLPPRLAPRLAHRLAVSFADPLVARADTIEGMKFLVVDRRLYLRVQYLVNLVMTSHSCVRHAMILHADQLVWSSLPVRRARTLHVEHAFGSSPVRALGLCPWVGAAGWLCLCWLVVCARLA